MTTHTKALVAILISAGLWASAGSVSKLLFMEVPPFVAASHRFLLASLIIFPFFLRTKKPKGFWRALLPLGLFNTGNILFYYLGLSLTTANTGSILGTTIPISVALFSPLFLHEPIQKNKLVGICIGLIGALCIVLVPMIDKGNVASGSLLGNIFMVGSLLSWTMYIIFSRRILLHGNFSPILSTSVNIFTVTIAATIAALLAGQTLLSPALSVPTYTGVLLYAAIGITIVTFFLFQWGVQHVSASTASLKEYVQLVIAVAINAIILGERLTLTYILGSALIIVGVLFSTGSKLSKKMASVLFNQGE
jgi:drug/metabolite transporter (DMT)-like permease